MHTTKNRHRYRKPSAPITCNGQPIIKELALAAKQALFQASKPARKRPIRQADKPLPTNSTAQRNMDKLDAMAACGQWDLVPLHNKDQAQYERLYPQDTHGKNWQR